MTLNDFFAKFAEECDDDDDWVPRHRFTENVLVTTAISTVMDHALSEYNAPRLNPFPVCSNKSAWVEVRGTIGRISKGTNACFVQLINETDFIYSRPTVSHSRTTTCTRRHDNRRRGEKHKRERNSARIVAYHWHISHSAWNKLMHALHGNGVINRIYTDGMPTLKQNNTVEDYVSWHIDFTAWTRGQGAYNCIIERPVVLLTADLTQQKKDEQEGLRYLAAAIDDVDIRTAVMTSASNSGITGYAFLRDLMLQGSNLQSSIQTTIDNMTYAVGQSPMTFKLRFMKFTNALEPKPSDRILTSKFADALRRNTDSLYDDCISAAGAAGKDDKFDEYSTLLIKLVTQKQSRPGIKNEGEVAARQTMIQDLAKEVKQLRSTSMQPRERDRPHGKPPGGVDEKQGNRICGRCGKTGHLKYDCSLPAQCCPFVFPNGDKCARDHVIDTCFFKDPSLCSDPKIREIVETKLEKKSTTTCGHRTTTHHEDDDYVDEYDEAEAQTTVIYA